jgi:hypothetical protein
MSNIITIPVDTVISTKDQEMSFKFNWLGEEGDYEHCTLTCVVPYNHTVRELKTILAIEENITKLFVTLVNNLDDSDSLVTKVIKRGIIEE